MLKFERKKIEKKEGIRSKGKKKGEKPMTIFFFFFSKPEGSV